MDINTKLQTKVNRWLDDTSQILNIRNLNLKKWPDVLTGKEHLIVKLDCSFNKLTTLPGGLSNLKWLQCNYNKLNTIPKGLSNLRKLNCSNNILTTIPRFLFKLKTLWCSHNKLTTLPEFSSNLTELLCNSNQLTSLGKGPKCLSNLKGLDCSFNKLNSLVDLSNLEKLHCSNNKLTTLPGGLSNLKELLCFHNKLTTLPGCLSNLKELYCFEGEFMGVSKFERSENKLFSGKISEWKKIWPLQRTYINTLQSNGIKRVIKTLKLRLYLPRLDQLHRELLFSPNHPGEFYKELRWGKWSK